MTFVNVLATLIFCAALYALVHVVTQFILFINRSLRLLKAGLASESFDSSPIWNVRAPYTEYIRSRTLFGLAVFYPISFLTSLFLAFHLQGELHVAAIIALAAAVIAGNSIVVAALYYDWTWNKSEERCDTFAL